MFTPYLLLALAIVALWVTPKWVQQRRGRDIWVPVFLAALGSAWINGAVDGRGVLVSLLFGLITWLYYRADLSPRVKGILAILLLGGAVGLMLHQLPGFANRRVLSAVRFTPDAVPFSLYLNFDKTLVGLFVLGWGAARVSGVRQWWEIGRRSMPIAAALILVVLGLSLACGYVRFAPKYPHATPLWMAINLLAVCTAEEALFRGFIQTELTKLWSRWSRGAWAAVIAASALFGLAHAAGGATYVALATVAGLGYGWIYQRTGRIEGSILTHFALNTVHFLLFTYPALAR